jgi:subtilase family serine protease
MRSRLLALAALAGALPFASEASAVARIAPATTARATIAVAGGAPRNAELQLVVPLVADDQGLQRFAHQVSTPGSASYGVYETISMLAQRFGARPSVRAAARRYLRGVGARQVKINPTGMFAEATISVAAAERAFITPLRRFRAADGGTFIAPELHGSASAAGVQIPSGLRGVATGIVGLNTRRLRGGPPPGGSGPARRRYRTHRHAHAAAGQPASGYLPVTGTPAGCAGGLSSGGFTPNQYLSAYNYAPLRQAGLAGQGERVALIEIDGFKYSDIRAFAQCFGLDIPRLSTFYVGSKHALPPGGETTLDLEVLDAVAPRLDSIEIYENSGNASDVTKSLVLPLIAPGAKPQIVSASLGLCEPFMRAAFGLAGIKAVERDVELAAATGITLVASSGDEGSAACVDGNGHVVDQAAVNYPASSPWITAVGGTNVVLSPSNSILQERVWNDTNLQLAAGGGGFSQVFGRPSYQSHAVSANTRALPDVSMLADVAPGYAVYCTATSDPNCASSPWHTVGGTSAAAPLLAGGVALVNQDLHRHEREFLGFMNPLLYAIGGSPQSASVFSDVTAIGNDVGPYIPGGDGQPLGCCSATAGFDEASGWGSVNLANLDGVARQVLPQYGDVSVAIPRPQKPIRDRALRVRLHCSDACAVYSFAVLTLGGARSSDFTIHSSRYRFRSRASKTVPLPISAKQAARMRAALAKHHRIEAEVFAVALDARGQVAKVTAGRTIVIRG